MTEPNTGTAWWDSLERWSATLFLVAGVLLVIFGALLGVEAFTERSAPEDIFGPPGYAIAFVGLLGLYPTLADRSRLLARAGAVIAAVAVAGWMAITVLAFFELAGVLPPVEELGALGAAALAPTGLGMILGYPLFSIASLWSGAHSRALGLLLFAPTVIFVVVFAVVAPLGVAESWGPFVAGSAQAVAHLAIGFVLRTEGVPTARK